MITLPMLPAARPVDPEWKCCRSGDCCTQPEEVVMTHQERQLLMRHTPTGLVTHWRVVDEKFAALKAKPCPFYAFKQCLVYAVRPFNCRRFGCLRPDVRAEPFEASGANLMDRVKTSRVARRMAERMQRRARRWADKMGWMSAAE